MTISIQDNPGVVAPPPLIYAGTLAIGLLVHLFFPVKFFPKVGATLIGRLCATIGGTLALSAFFEMRRAGTHVDPTQPATTLVTHGPFSLTRNPIYLSLTLLYTSIALMVNSLSAILLLPGALLIMRYGVIEREERYLERKFGNLYVNYKTKVRRWI